MTILAEPLYFDGSAVLKTSLHNATEMCVRCVNSIAACAGMMSHGEGAKRTTFFAPSHFHSGEL